MKKEKILTIILLSILFMLLFAWFEVRPIYIVRKCHKKSIEMSKDKTTKYYELGYKLCLRNYGINR